MKALIAIDYTNDFIADTGALTLGKVGQRIEKPVVDVTSAFIDRGDFVVFAIDNHDETDHFHPENKLYPPHNLVGSSGQQLFGSLQSLYQKNQANKSIYYLPKRRYSAFCGTDLDVRLREREIKEIHLSGVCTDICVLHTAIEAYNLGYSIAIHQKAVASFDPIGHNWALSHMEKTLGAKIV